MGSVAHSREWRDVRVTPWGDEDRCLSTHGGGRSRGWELPSSNVIKGGRAVSATVATNAATYMTYMHSRIKSYPGTSLMDIFTACAGRVSQGSAKYGQGDL